jgi:hypothetical protein
MAEMLGCAQVFLLDLSRNRPRRRPRNFGSDLESISWTGAKSFCPEGVRGWQQATR